MKKQGSSGTARLVLAAVTMFVALGAAPALAGPISQEPTGRFLVADFSISPPRAGTIQRPQGVSMEFNDLAGNDLIGQQTAGAEQTHLEEFRLARGMTINYRKFPSCAYRSLARRGPPACPRASRVATGTLITDFRPVVPTFFPVVCSAFNGRGPEHEPALLVWCKSDFGASGTEWYDILPPADGFGPSFTHDFGPKLPQGVAQGETGGHLAFPDSTVTIRGRRVHYLDAPYNCHGSWMFEQLNIRYNGTRSVATSREPCVR